MTRSNTNSKAQRFVAMLDEASTLLRKARKHRHSLSGNGYYAKAYWEKIGEIKREGEILGGELESRGLDQEGDLLRTAVERVVSIQSSAADADAELARARTTWCVRVEPSLHTTGPRKKRSKNFLPPELRTSIQGLLRPVFDQIEGCYAYEFRDAALVMLRKLVESLIIEGYEKAGRGTEIKKSTGEYVSFGDLVGKAKGGSLFRLGRDSRSAIDEVKKLADNAAHNPHFHAQRSQVNGLRSGAGILVQDLLRQIDGFASS